ncbi:MAG: hypothetical protein PHG05_01990 [Candidatus Nanoarchaeia archaeon]|nr:hypothetical protein [Candidatus Nanoarchaeia archaeon]
MPEINKKGAEVSLNVIIIGIILIIVLVIVVVFFLYGFKNVTDKAKGIFFSGTTGTDENLAKQLCNTYCGTIEKKADAPKSAFCQKTFDVIAAKSGETKPKKCIDLNVECKVNGEAITC